MSRFMSKRFATLESYVPGEQPKTMQYIKLNTNESPFAPSNGVLEAVSEQGKLLQLYSDPDATNLVKEAARVFGVKESQILMTNGSDEILNFAFMTFGDSEHPFVFPALTYGFYPVFAKVNSIPYKEIPLKSDFSIDPADYHNAGGNVVIANPNAPTGLTLSLAEIEGILKTNPNHVVVIDEAYVDFGGETAIPLVEQYDNLIVTRTFSKSYSMAGARLGFGIANESLIADMNTIKFSTNPYNVNRMTMAAGTAALQDNEYYMNNCRTIVEVREWTKEQLARLGFVMTDSKANFIFAKHPKVSGETLYQQLKERGILVRHFSRSDIADYNRITVGTKEQMEALLLQTKAILQEVN
ncbi:MAG: histidinol-phosphate transaminase [Clostridia bacterium]|nr:histidinol-phosphate transaminase [Clostridia bacterium]